MPLVKSNSMEVIFSECIGNGGGQGFVVTGLRMLGNLLAICLYGLLLQISPQRRPDVFRLIHSAYQQLSSPTHQAVYAFSTLGAAVDDLFSPSSAAVATTLLPKAPASGPSTQYAFPAIRLLQSAFSSGFQPCSCCIVTP